MTDMIGAPAAAADHAHSWIHATLRRAVARAERASGRPEVVDLEPDQWRQVPEERIGRKPSGGQD